MEQFTRGQYSGTIVSAYQQSGIIFSRTTYKHDQFNPIRHYHTNAHVSLVIGGGCLEQKKKEYQRLPGSLTLYHAGEPHQIRQVAPISTHLNLEIEQLFLQHYQLDENTLSRALSHRPDGKFLLVKMQHEVLANDPHTALSMQMLLLDFAAEAKHIGHTRPSWINRIRDLLEENWTEPIRLDRLSAATGMHPVTVSKCFHRYFGCTIGHYLRKLKIEQALSLMNQKGISLAEITYQCGFADQSHFIRTFKELTHCLPSTYQSLLTG